MTVWPSALGRVHSRRPSKWWTILLLAALAFVIGLGVSYLVNGKTTVERIAVAAQVRWEATSVSCAKPRHVGVATASYRSGLPQHVYSCVIGGIPAGLATSNKSTLTLCYGVGKTGKILDVTNTIVYLRRHHQTFGLTCDH